MHYQDLMNSSKIRVCPISAMWLLLTLLLSILLLSSCTTPKSINRSYTKPLEKTTSHRPIDEKDDVNTKGSSDKDDEFNKLLKEAKSKNTNNKNKTISKNADDNLNKAAINEEMPKFDELLKSMNKDIENIKQDVVVLKNDNVEIKSSLEEIKEALRVIHKNEPRKSVVGDLSNDNNEIKVNSSKQTSERPIYTEQDKLSSTPKPKKNILSNEAVNQKKNKNTDTQTNSKNNSIASNQSITKKQSEDKVTPLPSKTVIPEKPVADVQKKENSNAPADSKLTIAMSNIKSKNYKQAINDLIEILNSTNNENLKGETQYYLAESHFGLKDYDKAIDSYKNVIKSPKQDLYDDSQYKIADSYYKKGKNDIAKAEYQNLVKKYPTSQYLPIARKMLQQL